MPDKKISELIAVTSLEGSEAIPVIQGSATKRTSAKEISKFGYQDVVADAGAAKTLSLADLGAWIRATVASTYTIPTNATVAFLVGSTFNGIQAGVGPVTFVGASGVTLNIPTDYAAKTRAKGSPWCLVKVAANEWDLVGDLEAV